MTTSRHHYLPEMLASQPVFQGLRPEEISSLAQGTCEFSVHRHEILFQKGDVLRGVYLVVTGQIKLALTNQAGVETILEMASTGDTFGEESVLSSLMTPISAQANKDSHLLLVQKQALSEAMRNNADFANRLMANMGTRMCQLIDSLETCVQRSSAQRVAHFLTQRAPERPGSYDVELDVNKSTIASQLNLAPETFSRVLKRLSGEGLINLKGRCITLLDLDSLRAYAG